MSESEAKRKRRSDANVNSPSPWGTKQSKAYTHRYRSPAGSGPPGTTNVTRITLHKERPQTGSSTKDAYGFRKPTAFRAYVVSQVNDRPYEYKASLSAFGSPTTYFGDLSGLPQSDSIYDGCAGAGHFPRVGTNQRNRATTEALNKVKDSEYSFGEDIAELDSTLQMLAAALKRAVTALVAIRQKNWRKAADALTGTSSTTYRPKRKPLTGPTTAMDRARHKRTGELRNAIAEDMKRRRKGSAADAISSNWLEYQYGWAPLLQLISALRAQAAQEAALAKMPLMTVKHTVVDNDSLPGRPGNYGLWSVSGHIKNIVFVRLDYRVTDNNLATLDSLGLANPLALAWNLAPLSFVVDWLIPVGNTLQGLTAGWGISYVSGSRTETTLAELQYQYVSQPYYKGGSPRKCGLKSLATQRVVLPSLPLPRLYVKSPFTFTRLATTLALLHQLRR